MGSVPWEIILEYSKFGSSLALHANQQNYKKDFPTFLRIEYSRIFSIEILRLFNSFDKTVYLYRCPHDVMISTFQYFSSTNREDINLKDNKYFHDYVRYRLPRYISHIEVSMSYCDLVLCYDKLLKDPSNFRKLLLFFYEELDEEIYQKTLEFSSFKKVHEQEVELTKDRPNHVFHTRDGRSGQYKDVMDKSLIDYIDKKWKKVEDLIHNLS